MVFKLKNSTQILVSKNLELSTEINNLNTD